MSLHYDVSLLDITRAKHDSRECSCKFHVHFDHDKTEVILPFEHFFIHTMTV
jgi:hypothetical protein